MKIYLLFLVGFIVGAIAHERDIARNCNNYGNAKAWVSDIKCQK